MKVRKIMVLVVIILAIALNWNSITGLFDTKENAIVGHVTNVPEIPKEVNTDHAVYFCPQDNCAQQLIEWINLAQKEVHCAFYDVDLEEVRDALVSKEKEGVDVKVVVDADNYDFFEGIPFVQMDTRTAIMHNKFCTIDDQVVWTGSFNPTHRGNEKNNNNVVVYQSKYLAENYEDEFFEMWGGGFGRGPLVNHSSVIVDGKKIENYFCPEDDCADNVILALASANESIYFMTFSFTHDGIGTEILRKFERGVAVRGVFEKSQNNKYTEKTKFEDEGMDVRWDGNPANMHNKVFIIDEKTVITGSMNPSKNGDKNNDENILIIHDPSVAADFMEDFKRVWSAASEVES